MEMLKGVMGEGHRSQSLANAQPPHPVLGVTSLAGLHFRGQLFVKGHLVTLPRSASFMLA